MWIPCESLKGKVKETDGVYCYCEEINTAGKLWCVVVYFTVKDLC